MSPVISAEHIEERLRDHKPLELDASECPKRAAVAMVLRPERGVASSLGVEVLLMKRASNPTDRWSGQVSLPGGREEPSDTELIETAIRETREEVAVDLARHARFVGQLDAMQARNRTGLTGLAVTPFVFVATEPLVPQSSVEAELVFWLPLGLAAGGEISGEMPYDIGGRTIQLPIWTYESQVVWGMTRSMLAGLLKLL